MIGVPPGVMKRSVSEGLGLRRNVAVLAASVFGIGLAEELWLVFLPKYLASLGASGAVIGLFASTRDLLDGLYHYPGGWRSGRPRVSRGYRR